MDKSSHNANATDEKIADTASESVVSHSNNETIDMEPFARRPLRDSAADAITHFLGEIDEQHTDLYNMVIAQVEEPLLAAVMKHTHDNQSQASKLLGLNRGTLRKKLRRYGLV